MNKFTKIIALRRDRTLSKKNTKKEIAALKRRERRVKKETQILREVRRKRSVGGRIGGALTKGVGVARRGVTQSLLDRSKPVSSSGRGAQETHEYDTMFTQTTRAKGLTKTGGVKTGKRGRPRGSYDQRYAKWGGVYGYRKAIAQRNRLEKIQAMRNAAVTPRQQVVLESIEERRRMQNTSIERRRFPDTAGDVSMGSFMRDVDTAANLVD